MNQTSFPTLTPWVSALTVTWGDQVTGAINAIQAGMVDLQATSPGTAQTGNANISGDLRAGGVLYGDGTGITGLLIAQIAGLAAQLAALVLRSGDTMEGDLDADPDVKFDGVDVGSHDHSGADGHGVNIPVASITAPSGFTPALHAATHAVGQSDAVSPASIGASPGAHDHSNTGDNGAKLAQANTHESADTDSIATALHHTLGTGGLQACAGDDARLTDARTPAAHAASHNATGGDELAIDAVAATGSLRTLGTTSTSACAGDDSRLTDSRTPTAHSASHQGGADALTVDAVAGTGSLRTLGTGSTNAAAGDHTHTAAPVMMGFSTLHEVISRWYLTKSSGAGTTETAVAGSGGATITAIAAAGLAAYAQIGINLITTHYPFLDLPACHILLKQGTVPTTGNAFFGMGMKSGFAAGGVTWTGDHAGIRANTAASATTYQATQADGTTEATAAFTYGYSIYFKVGASNVKYYSDRTLRATIASNMPRTNQVDYYLTYGAWTAANMGTQTWTIAWASVQFQMDA